MIDTMPGNALLVLTLPECQSYDGPVQQVQHEFLDAVLPLSAREFLLKEWPVIADATHCDSKVRRTLLVRRLMVSNNAADKTSGRRMTFKAAASRA